MKKLYLINYENWTSREDIERKLTNAGVLGPVFSSMPNSLFVFSSFSSREIYDKVVLNQPNHGRLFITEVTRHNSYGWMPSSHWELIAKNSAAHDYNLVFRGYWRDKNRGSLPAESGVYCVYASTYNPVSDTVSLHHLLYIGKSVNVQDRHKNHEGREAWVKQLKSDEELSYSFAPLPARSLSVCEAALIFKHKPICNDVCKDSFAHSNTHIKTSGRNACLSTDFTVSRVD